MQAQERGRRGAKPGYGERLRDRSDRPAREIPDGSNIRHGIWNKVSRKITLFDFRALGWIYLLIYKRFDMPQPLNMCSPIRSLIESGFSADTRSDVKLFYGARNLDRMAYQVSRHEILFICFHMLNFNL